MMRLTLRTLLAYLDDMLEPADTKIMGQKIQESPMAQLLVSRIREVMRRRRLKAPDVSGPEMGIDPNIVAQYLDNTLPPERYADVERVLLASDEMLAEAASCHQVLTVDPPEVAKSTRDRLYALGPVDEDSQLLVAPEPAPVSSSRTPHSIPIRNGLNALDERATASQRIHEGPTTTVPDYLKRSSWTRRMLPTAIIGILILASAALLAPEFLTRIRQAKTEINRKDGREKSTASTNTEPASVADEAAEIASRLDAVTLPETRDNSRNEAKAVVPAIDPAPPADESEEMPEVAANRTPVSPPAKEPRAATVERKPEVVVPETVGDDPPPAPKEFAQAGADAAKIVPITYTSNEGVLLRFDPDQRHWFLVPHRSALHPGELVASVEPFESLLDFDRGAVKSTLVGETVVSLLPPEAGIPGFVVQRGRIVFQNGRQEDGQMPSIGIAIGTDLWTLQFASRETLCGLEVTSRESSEFQKLVGEEWYQATLYVIAGSVQWTNRDGKTQEINERTALNIVPEKQAQMRSSPISFPTAPEWCDAAKRKLMPIRKHQSQLQFEKAFELDQPIDESMLNLVKNSKFPKIAELAALCLSATDDYESMVEILAECPHEEARFAARDGLRRWLPLQPDHASKLKEALDSYYPPADADAVYRMLWGYTREDVTNSKTNSWQFMNWMRSPKVEIRELADYWVERLTEKRTEYRAVGGTAAQRESQVRRLEEQIERNNGLIKAQ